MNLAENLKKIRKENHLSQEDLAEKLGVSRQSVSKWESNQAYPEMEKMIQLCNLFNLNIDDLLNQDIGEINNIKQAKNSINKFIEDFLGYITKTIDMFSSMKLKDKFKCLFEQILIIGLLFILFLIIGSILEDLIISPLFSIFPEEAYYKFIGILKLIYNVACIIVGVILLLHIFKTRYLDYYEIVKDSSNELIEKKDNSKEVNDEPEKIYLKKKKEKIIIRDPKHSEYKFINSLVKLFLIFVKCFAFIIGILFSISMITFTITMVLSFMFVKTGIMFIGILLILISCIIVNYVILKILYDFIFEHKSKKKRLALLFLFSLMICGVGIGFTSIGITQFDIVSFNDEKYYITKEQTIKMNDDLVICGHIQYVESNNSDIKVVTKTTKYNNIKLEVNDNVYLYYNYLDEFNIFDILRDTIENINNKKILMYDTYEIKIYSNKDNLNKLQSNLEKYFNRQNELY